jgi:hypothetical protein
MMVMAWDIGAYIVQLEHEDGVAFLHEHGVMCNTLYRFDKFPWISLQRVHFH